MNLKLGAVISQILLLLNQIYFVEAQCVQSDQMVTSTVDCFNRSDNDNYCCALSLITDPNDQFLCYEVKKSDYQGETKTIYLNSKYYMDCGPRAAKESVILSEIYRCGPHSPKIVNDCWEYSREKNSCCYFNMSQGRQGCGWAGIKYSGNSSLITDTTAFSCNNHYIKLSFSVFSLLMLIVITY